MSAFVRQLNRGSTHGHAHSIDADSSHSSPRLHQQSSKAIRRESKLTVGGTVYVVVTLFLAIGAINSQNNLLFWLFGVAIATMIVSGVFSGNVLMQIRLKAQAIPDSIAGDSVRLHYTVINRSKFFPLFAAMISEIHDDDHPRGQFESAAVLHLGPKQRKKFTGVFVPASRGRHTVRHIRLSTRFPFGLLQKSLIFECPRSMMILPYQLAIKPELVRVVHGQGEEVHKRTDASGVSSEYWGLREYTPGDPKRSIAWKQSARHRKLVVIEHAQPIASKLWVWIANDQSDSILAERSIAIGASLITHAAKRGVPIGLWAPSLGVRIIPGTGKAHTMRCLRALGMIDLESEHAHDAPPRAANADDVLAVQAHPKQVASSGRIRILDARDPSHWLIDPSSLPEMLGGSS